MATLNKVTTIRFVDRQGNRVPKGTPKAKKIKYKSAKWYGVWREKKYMGRSYMGVTRSTFVIDADGKVKKIFPNVKPATHADDVLEALAN